MNIFPAKPVVFLCRLLTYVEPRWYIDDTGNFPPLKKELMQDACTVVRYI